MFTLVKIILILISIPFLLWLLMFVIEFIFDGSRNKRVTFDVVQMELIPYHIKVRSCSNCGLSAHELHWFKFRSSNASWRNLAGIEGFYVRCPICKKNRGEFVTVIN